MASKISFKDYYFYTIHGYSNRDMADIFNVGKSTVAYQQQKYGLSNLVKYKKNPNFNFNKIDTPEKAYVLGFILADSGIDKKHNVEISVALKDKAVIDFISFVIDSNVFTSTKFNKKLRIFPKARTNKKIKDITKFTGGEAKKDRHYPRVRKDLERYLLLGFFDGDGCITWGRRKDRNRLWHKISFTSSYKMLYGVQQQLLKLGITTTLRQKSNEDCFVLEFSNKKDILTFLDYIYPKNSEFIVLQRKYLKQYALRLELEENGEGSEKLR